MHMVQFAGLGIMNLYSVRVSVVERTAWILRPFISVQTDLTFPPSGDPSIRHGPCTNPPLRSGLGRRVQQVSAGRLYGVILVQEAIIPCLLSRDQGFGICHRPPQCLFGRIKLMFAAGMRPMSYHALLSSHSGA